jgi:hypothetical protein
MPHLHGSGLALPIPTARRKRVVAANLSPLLPQTVTCCNCCGAAHAFFVEARAQQALSGQEGVYSCHSSQALTTHPHAHTWYQRRKLQQQQVQAVS